MKKILAGLIGLCTLITLIPLSYALNEETSKSSEYELVTVDETELGKGMGSMIGGDSEILKSFSFKDIQSEEDSLYTIQSLNYRCSDNFFKKTTLQLSDESLIQAKTSQTGSFTNYTFENINHSFHLNNRPFELKGFSRSDIYEESGLCNINQIVLSDDNNNELRLNQEIENNIFGSIQQIKLSSSYSNMFTLSTYLLVRERTRYIAENRKDTEILSYEFNSKEDNSKLDSVILLCSGKSIPFSNIRLNIDGTEFSPNHVFENSDKQNPENEATSKTIKQYYFTDLETNFSETNQLKASITADTGSIKLLEEKSNSIYSRGVNCHLAKVKLHKENGESESVSSSANNLFLGLQSDLKGAYDLSIENPNYEAIEYLIKKGILNGYPDGTFHPYKNINRAEVAKIIAESQLTKTEKVTNSCFPDINKEDWYNKYTCAMKAKGWIKGDGETGKFRPNQNINEIESLKIILESLGINLEKSPYLKDITINDESNLWKKKYILKGIELGLTNGGGWGYNSPLWGSTKMSRESFANMLYNAINQAGNLETQKEYYEITAGVTFWVAKKWILLV